MSSRLSEVNVFFCRPPMPAFKINTSNLCRVDNELHKDTQDCKDTVKLILEKVSKTTNLRSSARNLAANSLTEAKEEVSTFITTTDLLPVASSMSPVKENRGI